MPAKLGRPTDQRLAILKNQVSELLWYGKIETTVDRAKSVRSIAEKLITAAAKTYGDTQTVQKEKTNLKGDKVSVEFKNDGPRKLAVRRKLMSKLVDLHEVKGDKESKANFRARIKDINHPLIEKIFNEYGPKYESRPGGYTRIIKLGTRRGDNAEIAILELV
ncbi:MAG: 50S ribosomal protein L17 [Clostridiaceae bacterium]|jgi:large subunit ribosomal protein L17|nr:50S ribosomal protein L17 [Clostridiaceae bacterium]